MSQLSVASKMVEEERIRLWLASRYGVRGIFITLGCIAEILGMAPPTLMSHIRKERFVLPYKKVGASILIKVDDFVDWYCREDNISTRIIEKPAILAKETGHDPGDKEDYRQLMNEVMKKIAPAMRGNRSG